MQKYRIVRPETYTNKQGEEKTSWLLVGSIVQFDDGNLKLTLNHTSEKLLVYKDNPKNGDSEGVKSMAQEYLGAEEIKVDDIPF